MAENEPNPVANDEGGAEANRFNQQCFLMDNWKTYASGVNKGGYSNFTCIDGSPTDLVQALTSQKGNEAFLNIAPAQLALLQPKIKIFRVPLNRDGKALGPGEEIAFKTHYDQSTIASLTSNAAVRGDAVGLTEITYELMQGGDRATANNRQQITIKFKGESLGALAKGSSGTRGPLDMVIHSSATVSQYDKKGAAVPGTAKTNSKHYAIKLVYGWSIPDGDQHLISVPVKKALANSIQTQVLNLTGHTLDFKEDGSVELEGEYNGYADSKMDETDRNIIWSNPDLAKKVDTAKIDKQEANQTVEKKKAATKEAEAKAEKAEKKMESGENFGESIANYAKAAAGASHAKNAEDEAVDKANAKDTSLTTAVQADRTEKYNRLVNALAEANKIYFVDVDQAAIGAISGTMFSSATTDTNLAATKTAKKTPEEIAKMTPEQKEKYEKDRAASAKSASTPPPPAKAGGDATALKNAAKATEQHGKDKVQEAKAKEAVKKADRDDSFIGKAVASAADGAAKEATSENMNSASAQNTASSPLGDGKVRINFMYFGDIFAVALRTAYRGKKLKIRHLMGPINFRDPRSGKWTTLNLADIPISLNLFSQFWINKVVSPQKDVYTIKKFLNDAVSELILAALGDDCFQGAGKITTDPPQLSMEVISAPAGQKGVDRLGTSKRINPLKGDVKPKPKENILGNAAFSKPEDHIEYFFIYCYAWTSRNLKGNRFDDANRGIYHIAMGQDKGPVKSITFEKNDDLSDAMQTKAMMEGRGIEALSAAYEAKVTMVGNSLFAAGNYLFIEPGSLGMGRGMAFNLGLGGYYTVTKVTGKVDSAGWETELECIPFGSTQGLADTLVRSGDAKAPDQTAYPKNGNNPETK